MTQGAKLEELVPTVLFYGWDDKHAHVKPVAQPGFTDWQAAVVFQDQQQCSNKGKKEQRYEQVNMDVNNAANFFFRHKAVLR